MKGLWFLLNKGKKLPKKNIERSTNTILHRGEAGFGSYVGYDDDSFSLEKKKSLLEFPKTRKAHAWAVNFMDSVSLKNFLPIVYIGKKNITKTNFCANDVLLCFADGKFIIPDGLEKELITDGFEIKAETDVAVFGAYVQKGILEGLSLFDSVVKAITDIPCVASVIFIKNNEIVIHTDPLNVTNLAIYIYKGELINGNKKNLFSVASEPQAFGELDPFYWEKIMKNHPFSNGFRDLFAGEVIGLYDNEIVKSALIKLENLNWAGGSGTKVKCFDVKNDSLDELIELMPWIDDDGLIHDGSVEEYHCVFEDIYKKNPPALNHLVSTIRFRARLSRYLSPVPEDVCKEDVVVIPVPDSGRSAASGYSNQHGYKLKEGLIKRVKKRSYPESDENRGELASDKYEIVPGAFNDGKKGKTVVFLDDSIVRGTTIYRAIIMAFEAGASEVFFKSTSPPLKNFCPFSDGMDKESDFVAMGRDLNGIYEWVFDQCKTEINEKYKEGIYTKEKHDYMLSKINKECVNIEYMTIDNLIECYDSFFVDKKQRICAGCITGEFPFKA